MLTTEQKERYGRQILVPEISGAGQGRLADVLEIKGNDMIDNDFSKYEPADLHDLISTHEDWLLQRLTHYVVEMGFGEHVPPLIESWRLAISGITESILIGLKDLYPDFELKPALDAVSDPVSRFAVLEAHRHRERGITLDMFLGLLIYFRQIYLDLIRYKGRLCESTFRLLRINK